MPGWLPAAAAALITCRFLLPAESAADGNTLWIVAAWLATAALWCWWSWRCGEITFRIDAFDAGIAALVAGHVIAALAVLFGEGDRRAALNMLWEWIGLGVLTLLLRQAIVTAQQRRALALAIVAVAVVLSGLGLWQSYVWYPQTARDVAELQADYDRLSGRDALTPGEARRLQTIVRDAAAQGVPLEGRGRILFAQRLAASTEPLGLFALANTFGGFLASGLALLLGVIVSCGRRKALLLVGGTAAGIIAWCLLLTKSRTAWVGLLCGLAVIGWLRLRAKNGTNESANTAHHWRWLAGGLVTVGLLVGLAAATGRLDFAVLTEGSKSLRYRLEYWEGSLDVMRESPWLGTGPGNFRQHYLRYKRPESSEEIRDPHNFVLDVGSQAGLVGLFGLGAALCGGFLGFRRTKASARGENRVNTTQGHITSGPIWTGVASGFVLAFTGLLLFEQVSDDRIPVLLIGWAVAAVGLWRATPRSESISAWSACLAAIVVLLVHLTGAGGLSMPAVFQLFPLFVVLSGGSPAPRTASPRVALALAATCLLLGFACLATGVLPVLKSQTAIAAAQAEVLSGRRAAAQRGGEWFHQAAQADRYSSRPWVGLSELAYRSWERSGYRDADEFTAFVEHMQAAWNRDPRGFAYPRRIGEGYLKKFEVHGATADAQQAAEYLGRAAERYPTHPEIRASRAIALAGASNGSAAAEEARRALQLDAINRRLGHTDRLLSEPTLQQLHTLAGPEPAEVNAATNPEQTRTPDTGAGNAN